MNRSFCVLAFAVAVLAVGACGPVPRPKDAYGDAGDLIGDMMKLRARGTSFRIAGRIDHFGAQRVQGKVYLFAVPPDKLRVELVSPMGSTLAALTAAAGRFSMSDERESRYYRGAAEPCNIARLIRIPLPPEDVIGILAGKSPVIEGRREVRWDSEGHYDVTIRGDGGREQLLEIGPERSSLPLISSRITENGEVALDLRCDRWGSVGGVNVPHEIRIKMPAHDVDILARYDSDGVEVNVDILDDAWVHVFPEGARVEDVVCP